MFRQSTRQSRHRRRWWRGSPHSLRVITIVHRERRVECFDLSLTAWSGSPDRPETSSAVIACLLDWQTRPVDQGSAGPCPVAFRIGTGVTLFPRRLLTETTRPRPPDAFRSGRRKSDYPSGIIHQILVLDTTTSQISAVWRDRAGRLGPGR